MIRRSSLKSVNKYLSTKSNWNILDIGCGYRANEYASVLADAQDLSSLYKGKKFVKILDKKLPFKDKEFDYVIASHVIEHVNDFQFFIKELERISDKGYIELPTRLADNLVFENKTDHIWWFVFDDENNELLACKKKEFVEPFITVSTGKLFEEMFRESFIIELTWENEINYKIDENLYTTKFPNFSFTKLVRKFISKKIRNFYR